MMPRKEKMYREKKKIYIGYLLVLSFFPFFKICPFILLFCPV